MMTDPDRGTGRTQRMLEEAVAACMAGENVDVLGANRASALTMADRVWRMYTPSYPELVRRSVWRFEHRSGGTLEFLSAHSNLKGRRSVVFTDHAVTSAVPPPGASQEDTR